MPALLPETFPHALVPNPDLDPLLPSNLAGPSNRAQHHDRRLSSSSNDSIELQSIRTSPDIHDAKSDTSAVESRRSLDGESSMSRSRRSQHNKRSGVAPLKTKHDRDSTMNTNSGVEFRRKNVSLEEGTPVHTEALLARESFSLDDDPHSRPIGREEDYENDHSNSASLLSLSPKDQRNFALLVLLYFLQGVPMGLALGSVPFLLKSRLSYGQIGVFSLSIYPYSMKLLWSPIVDAIWSKKLGRRKSWIVPIQTLSSIMLIWLGRKADWLMENATEHLYLFTFVFFTLVMLCATQDIAVDGWALTLLSPENLAYSSTAQTVGITAGHFLSFTVFLAFNSPDFANRYFRKTPSTEGLMTLSGYLTFWGWAYLVVTIGLALLKKEEKTVSREGLRSVYLTMWQVLKLKHVQTFIIIHLISKIGFQANDAVTNLKLLDKGFSQEDMALTVLIDFPFEIGLGFYAGKWCAYFSPMRLYLWSYIGRLVAACLAHVTVWIFPRDGKVGVGYLLVVITEHIFSTFTGTIMFVAVSAFHARVADPKIGGTYMTLLATVSNLGGTFPRYFVLKLVDVLTYATCYPPAESEKGSFESFSCALEPDKRKCLDMGGTCTIHHDGYYSTNIICLTLGTAIFIWYVRPKVNYLMSLPLRAWRDYGGR